MDKCDLLSVAKVELKSLWADGYITSSGRIGVGISSHDAFAMVLVQGEELGVVIST